MTVLFIVVQNQNIMGVFSDIDRATRLENTIPGCKLDVCILDRVSFAANDILDKFNLTFSDDADCICTEACSVPKVPQNTKFRRVTRSQSASRQNLDAA